MDWHLYPLLMFLAVLGLWVGLDLWHTARCTSYRAARRAVREWNPRWEVTDSNHRASEPERDVVAVFYQDPPSHCEPSPYVLVAVGRSGEIEGLPVSANPQYALMPRK